LATAGTLAVPGLTAPKEPEYVPQRVPLYA